MVREGQCLLKKQTRLRSLGQPFVSYEPRSGHLRACLRGYCCIGCDRRERRDCRHENPPPPACS